MRPRLRPTRASRVALIAAAATAVGIPATQALGGDTRRPGDPSAAATVTRGPLTSQVHATGTLQYLAQPDDSPYTVIDHTGGTLTALPAVGDVIEQGHVIYRVADHPVVLLNGTTPAYRALSEGDTGPDVRELNADLVALGYASRSELDPSSDYFSASTATALEKLQARLGLTQTGTLPLGQAVFLPAPIRVTAVTATLGVRYAPIAPHPEFVDLVTPSSSTNTGADRRPDKCNPHKKRKHTNCKQPQKRRHHKPGRHAHSPGHGRKPVGAPGASGKPRGSGSPGRGSGSPGRGSGSPGGGSGSPGGGSGSPGGGSGSPGGGSGSPGAASPPPTPARPILQATSTRREVIVQLDARTTRSVKLGQHALVTLPSGRTTAATVTGIGTAASASGEVPVHLSLEHPSLAGNLDQASVQVRITTASVAEALRVPVTALTAQQDGQFAIRTVGSHGATRLVPVQVGLFDDATGLVQVTGPLTPGEQVLEPGGKVR